jgi:hypothetical protein
MTSRWDLLPYEIRSRIYSFHRDPGAEAPDYRKLMKPVLHDIWCASWFRWMQTLDNTIKKVAALYLFYMWQLKGGSYYMFDRCPHLRDFKFPDVCHIEIFVYDVGGSGGRSKTGVTVKMNNHTMFRGYVRDQAQYEKMVERNYPLSSRSVYIHSKKYPEICHYVKRRCLFW